MIKYLGSKRKLIPYILGVVKAFPDAKSVMDVFSGTSRVGHALKKHGYRVIANDYATFAATLARCYVQADAEDRLVEAGKLISEFNRIPGRYGYFTETFCVRSRFFHPKNGERIDAIREAIAAKNLDPELEAILLTSLMEAADRVDSTTGVQMAYLKRWAPRAYLDLELRVPEILPRPAHGKCVVTQLDARDAARQHHADIAYLDPPYNQHSYLSNYHIWETLVRWDCPPTYGVACKRSDIKDNRSDFNSKVRYRAALTDVLKHLNARVVIVSMNDEGFIHPSEMEALLRETHPDHHLFVIDIDYKRYVGAQIGIYNPQGERVGKVSHLRNREKIYIVSPHPCLLAARAVA